MSKVKSIPFITDDGDKVEFFVLEQTMVSGMSYLLVSEDLEDDSEEAVVYIMKGGMDSEEEGFSAYEMVEDEEELISISKIFEQLMDDMDISVE